MNLEQQLGHLTGLVEAVREDLREMKGRMASAADVAALEARQTLLEARVRTVELDQVGMSSKGGVYTRMLDWVFKGAAGAVLGLVIKHFVGA